MITSKLGYKISTKEEDLLEDGDDLYVLGEIKHPDIIEKIYIIITSKDDHGPLYVSENNIYISEETQKISVTPQLETILKQLQKKYPKCLY